MTPPIPSIPLSSGDTIPVLGYGLGTANFKRSSSPLDETIVSTTLSALHLGYHHLDGAESYNNETELGTAISQSGIPRSSLFITTKTSCHPSSTIESALSRSLSKLGVDYVDLYLIHSPFFATSREEHQAKWREMEALQDSGRVKAIGVSNYLREDLEAILETARYKPVVNQIEYHPYLQHGELVGWCKEQGIVVEAYAALTGVTKVQGPVDGVYQRLAEKYGVEKGDVALRWCLDQGVVAVTTSGSEKRLRGYLERVFSFKLTEEEISEISEEGRKLHYRGFWKNKFGEDDRR